MVGNNGDFIADLIFRVGLVDRSRQEYCDVFKVSLDDSIVFIERLFGPFCLCMLILVSRVHIWQVRDTFEIVRFCGSRSHWKYMTLSEFSRLKYILRKLYI